MTEYGYDKMMRRIFQKEQESKLERAAKIGGASALSGGVIAGAGSLLAASNIKQMIRNILLGAGTFGGIASGANLVGTAVVPGDEETDASINTRRGLVGGGLLGSAAGAGLGVAAASPRLNQAVAKSPLARRAMVASGIVPEASSLLQRGIAAARRNPYGAVAGGILGALGGAGAGAFLGADEGMQYDVLIQEMRRQRQ